MNDVNPNAGSPLEEKKPEQEAFVWGDGIGLEVSASKMSATLEIKLEAAEHYTPEDILKYLGDNNLATSVDSDAIRRIFDEGLFNQSVAAARGIPPKDGEDGYVDWSIDLSILEGAKLVEKGGRVDWKEKHHVLQVAADQKLAVLADPTPGEAGVNVYGEEIPPKPGKPAKFPAGKGLRINEDGTELFAEITGAVSMVDGKVSVSPILNIQGDVSLKTGNINYQETVEISGGVLSDFKIIAGQDIHINGLVEAAELTAGGNIYIAGGIQGYEKAKIRAGGDVVVKYINNAFVEAGGDVVVNGAISNSNVRAKKSVIVSGSKAVVVGGRISAEKEISASVIGSEIGSKTSLELGQDLVALINSMKDEEKKMESLAANYKKMQQANHTLNELRDKGKITPQQEELRLKIIRSGLHLQAQVKKMKNDIHLMEKQVETGRSQQKGIAAREVAWPGVMISIMGNLFPVKAMTSKAIFALRGREIEVFAYKEEDTKKKTEKAEK
ncbi:MAG: FapA family protein [Candidatus Omnitrophota bacterium]